MLSAYNTISIDFTNTNNSVTKIKVYCNIFNGRNNQSNFQIERADKFEYNWSASVIIEKNHFNKSLSQLTILKEILSGILLKEIHYSTPEVRNLMDKAIENDTFNNKYDNEEMLKIMS